MSQNVNIIGVARIRALGIIAVSVRVLSALQLQMKSDLANAFFNLAEFAESISYTHKRAGETKRYKSLFDDPTQNIRLGSQTEFIGVRPQVQLALQHMDHEPLIGDTLVVRGIIYGIDSYETDGAGVVTIYLIREGQS